MRGQSCGAKNKSPVLHGALIQQQTGDKLTLASVIRAAVFRPQFEYVPSRSSTQLTDFQISWPLVRGPTSPAQSDDEPHRARAQQHRSGWMPEHTSIPVR